MQTVILQKSFLEKGNGETTATIVKENGEPQGTIVKIRTNDIGVWITIQDVTNTSEVSSSPTLTNTVQIKNTKSKRKAKSPKYSKDKSQYIKVPQDVVEALIKSCSKKSVIKTANLLGVSDSYIHSLKRPDDKRKTMASPEFVDDVKRLLM